MCLACFQNLRADIESIQVAVKQNNFKKASGIGHKIKGVGGGYGFERITELGTAIEAAAKEQEPDAIILLTDELIQYIDTVKIVYE